MRGALRDLAAFALPLARLLEAQSCAEALRLFASEQPSAVLIDVGLPDGDGIETVRRMTVSAPATLVVVISIHASTQLAARARAAGATAFVGKDRLFPEVLPLVRRLGSQEIA